MNRDKFEVLYMNILDYLNIVTSTTEEGNMSYKYDNRDTVDKRRIEFAQKNKFNLNNIYIMSSSYDNFCEVTVLDKTSDYLTIVEDTDSLISKDKNIVLGLLTADCLSLSLYDTKQDIFALVHCGRQWVDAGIITETIEQMGSKGGDLVAHLGPSIYEEHYDWNENIFNVTNKDSYIYRNIKKIGDRYHIDIKNAVTENLLDLGVVYENILDSNVDTYSNQRYFSHNRSIDTNTPEGRHLTLVGTRFYKS